MVKRYVPEAGDIVWVDLSPTKGHEQAGSRPVVIVSFAAFNAVSGLCTCVPLTKKQKGYSNEVLLQRTGTSSVALVDQIRTVDFKVRKCVKKGTVPAEVLASIREKLGAILGIV